MDNFLARQPAVIDIFACREVYNPMTVDTIIDSLGGTCALSAALALEANTVSTWRARGYIPAARWPAIMRVAAAKGLDSVVTYDALAALIEPAPSEA